MLGISGYRNISDEFANQYYDGSSLTSMQPSESMSSSSRILLAISPANRNKRFLQKSHSDFPVSNEDKYFMDSSGITPADNLQTVSPTTERNPWDGVSPDLTIANFYTGDFLLPNERLCSLKHNLSLVVLVPSAVTHFKQREAVRNTWGSFTQRRDVVIGFVVGKLIWTLFCRKLCTSYYHTLVHLGNFDSHLINRTDRHWRMVLCHRRSKSIASG